MPPIQQPDPSGGGEERLRVLADVCVWGGSRPLLHSAVKTPTVFSKIGDQGPGPAGHQSQCQDALGTPGYLVCTDTKHPKSEVPICTWGRFRRQVGEHKSELAARLTPSSLSQRGTKFPGTRCPGHSQERVGLGDTAPAVSHLPYFHPLRSAASGTWPTNWP